MRAEPIGAVKPVTLWPQMLISALLVIAGAGIPEGQQRLRQEVLAAVGNALQAESGHGDAIANICFTRFIVQ